MANGGSLGAVYAGRFVAGLGIGQTVVVAPVYLAEIVSLFTNYLPSPSAKFYQLVTGSNSWYLHLQDSSIWELSLRTLPTMAVHSIVVTPLMPDG